MHATKTGGWTIRHMLEAAVQCRSTDHLPLVAGEHEFIVISVRNPYTRVYSLYYFSRLLRNCPFSKKLSFQEFVENYPPEVPEEWTWPACGYVPVFKQLRKHKPNFIVRFEHIAEDMAELGRVLGVSMPMRHYNKDRRKRPPFTMDVYTPAMLTRINEYFHTDFVTFGYEKVLP